MGNLSHNFSTHEFACQCNCGTGKIDEELVEVLQEARDFLGFSIKVTSGIRCAKHNEYVGGSATSKHKFGLAADIAVANMTPREVYDYFDSKYPDMYGIGVYRGWVHLDVRQRRARWDKT